MDELEQLLDENLYQPILTHVREHRKELRELAADEDTDVGKAAAALLDLDEGRQEEQRQLRRVYPDRYAEHALRCGVRGEGAQQLFMKLLADSNARDPEAIRDLFDAAVAATTDVDP